MAAARMALHPHTDQAEKVAVYRLHSNAVRTTSWLLEDQTSMVAVVSTRGSAVVPITPPRHVDLTTRDAAANTRPAAAVLIASHLPLDRITRAALATLINSDAAPMELQLLKDLMDKVNYNLRFIEAT